MLKTYIHLVCDDCKNPFPAVGICPGLQDGAIFTPAMLRHDAKIEGWTRPLAEDRSGGSRLRLDRCYRCTKKAAKK